ncbi:recombinase family protein [Streptomyces sp. LZ34]
MSLDEQKIGHGVKSQHEENEEFGEENGAPVNRWYQDVGISAFSGVDRPGYLELLADIAAGRIRIVIVWHADRLTRDVGEGHDFIKLCRKHNVKLFSQQRGAEYNFERASGRADFIADINAANKESGVKSERVALARKRQARNAEFGGGKRRYGWGVETGRYRSVCINPKADIADRVYEDRPILDMNKHRPNERDEIRRWKNEIFAGVSVRQILLDLNKRKVPTQSQTDERFVKRNGKEVKKNRWRRATVVGILVNPRTAGHIVYRGEIVKWNALPPIITEDERQALITLFSDPARKTTPGTTPKWFGSLIYECPTCPDAVHTVRGLSRTGVPLYQCQECGRGRQIATQVDDYVTKVLIERLSRPDIVSLIDTGPEVDIEKLRADLVPLQTRKKDASLLFSRGKIDAEQFATSTADINQQIKKIMDDLKAAVGESPLAPFALNHERAEETWKGLSLGRRRQILRTLCTVELKPAPKRKPGRRIKDAPPEELDLSTIIITPKQAAA